MQKRKLRGLEKPSIVEINGKCYLLLEGIEKDICLTQKKELGVSISFIRTVDVTTLLIKKLTDVNKSIWSGMVCSCN